MFSSKISALTLWNRVSMPLTAVAIFFTIASDRRPDDTSIQLALAAGLLAVFAILDLSISGLWTKSRNSNSSSLLTHFCIAFLVVCTLSAAWAGEPARTLEAMSIAWALFVAWVVLRMWADRQSLHRVNDLLRWTCFSIIGLTGLLASETIASQAIHEYLINSLSMDMSIPNYYMVAEDHIAVSPQFLAQHVGTISYLFWPILLAIYVSFERWRGATMVVFATFSLCSIFFSVNETAKLAFVTGITAFSLTLLLPRLAVLFTSLVFCFLIVASVPLSYYAHDVLQLQSNIFIPPSGQARFPIWYNVANTVGESAIFGHGVINLRALLHSGHGLIWEHAHSHNVFLQTWYEVGVIGSFLFLLIGLTFLKQLVRVSRLVVGFGIAGFVSITVSLLTTAWELWVPWHLGLLTLVAMLVSALERFSFDMARSRRP